MGIGLLGFGLFFIAFGCFLFMDRALLAMGNVFFLAGVVMVYGIQRSIVFFTTPARALGTSTFFAGFFLVLKGWCWVGMGIEAFGFVTLWGYVQVQCVLGLGLGYGEAAAADLPSLLFGRGVLAATTCRPPWPSCKSSR
jgi:hypothetical protein